MTRMISQGFFLPTLIQATMIATAAAQPAWIAVADQQARVEADWAVQDAVGRTASDLKGPVTTEDDARGACDGVKNGRWGFHTSGQEKPWWQVDLGAVQPLAKVLVYNRCDNGPQRAARLILSVSDGGAAWRECYRHNGTVFYGATDGKPLDVALNATPARFVRISLPDPGYMYLDEVEVYGTADPAKNLALGQPGNQSSISQWSTKKPLLTASAAFDVTLQRGRALAASLQQNGVDVATAAAELDRAERQWKQLPEKAADAERRSMYLGMRGTIRRIALANPLLDFDSILFVKRVPGSFSHMSDQNYGWWSRPGGGIYLLRGFKTGRPETVCLAGPDASDARAQFPPGSFASPDISYDGTKVLFAWCKHYPGIASERNKVDKSRLPDDAFFHVYEMSIDGTGVRQLTRGKYDDFDPRYLPNGEIAFLSTRRGQALQCGKLDTGLDRGSELPDSYVRCGGDHGRPVAVYTLHVADADGGNIRPISAFENFEWTPSVAADGRIMFARWDYVDRHNNAFMSLWGVDPDGTGLRIVYGNFTRSPHCVFEARSIPGSSKLVFTASGHHSFTAGSLCLLDPNAGVDGQQALTRLTPEVCFPEIDGWPGTYYCNPWPLSEHCFLTAWSPHPINFQGSGVDRRALGIYLFDAFGNLELLYRDPEITCQWPIPVRPRPKPPVHSAIANWDAPHEGRMLLLNVYSGLDGVPPGTVKRLRIVAVPAKTQPEMNTPIIGPTQEDPGKCVLGTVPVEDDGSANFRLPSGVNVFFQALDKDGVALQTMRTVTNVQPKEAISCIGCHEPRNLAPPVSRPLAGGRGGRTRPPSKIKPGPPGSWPLRFDTLVQPVLDRHCVSCHQPGGNAQAIAKLDLTPAAAYDSLTTYGGLRQQVYSKYIAGRSTPGAVIAADSLLVKHLRAGHQNVKLDDDDWERLFTWLDTYAQRLGSFSAEQEQHLIELRTKWKDLLDE